MLPLILLLVSCGKDKESPSDFLNAKDRFAVETELVFDIPSIDENFCIMQGGCVTDNYIWVLIVGVENYYNDFAKECYIVKYDRATMEEIGRSDKLKLGHANDMTYVAETNELYVAQCFANQVSIVDPESLTIKETICLDLYFSVYAIDYNPSKDSFVMGVGQAGMAMFDRELNLYDTAMPQDTTLVTQGICADDQYVYHVLYSTKSNTEEPDNMIFVLDWEGNLITKVPIGLEGYEPENISLVGNTFYIGCNDGDGGAIFTAKLKHAE